MELIIKKGTVPVKLPLPHSDFLYTLHQPIEYKNIGIGRFRILGGGVGMVKNIGGGHIPSRHMTS